MMRTTNSLQSSFHCILFGAVCVVGCGEPADSVSSEQSQPEDDACVGTPDVSEIEILDDEEHAWRFDYCFEQIGDVHTVHVVEYRNDSRPPRAFESSYHNREHSNGLFFCESSTDRLFFRYVDSTPDECDIVFELHIRGQEYAGPGTYLFEETYTTFPSAAFPLKRDSEDQNTLYPELLCGGRTFADPTVPHGFHENCDAQPSATAMCKVVVEGHTAESVFGIFECRFDRHYCELNSERGEYEPSTHALSLQAGRFRYLPSQCFGTR